jgi:hypothetical protein
MVLGSGLPPKPQIVPNYGPKPPWQVRRSSKDLKPDGWGLINLRIWPAEPTSPPQIESDRFAKAIGHLCGWMPPKRAQRYANWILEASRKFAVDPMLVGGLIYASSGCRPRLKKSTGLGLTHIHLQMHLNFIRKRQYRYWVLDGGVWQKRLRDIKAHLFYDRSLLHAEANIVFTAAFLSIFKEQCPAIDGAFRSVRHRHHVSHFIWGDRVRGTDGEDRVLLARRRLIQAYTGHRARPLGEYKGLRLACPLDGCPRKLTGKMGDPRDGGRRRHRGIDFASDVGEPVRAVADGVVIAAGVDRFGPGIRNLPPEKAARLNKREMPSGGLVVLLAHEKGLRSAYLHLDDYRVRRGQRVKMGERIGSVGRTGIRAAPAHLHFELRENQKRIDPIPHLVPHVISPLKMFKGLGLDYDQKREKRRKRSSK